MRRSTLLTQVLAVNAALVGVTATIAAIVARDRLADVASGQIPITWLSIAGALSFVKAGRVRALAISGRERSPSAPEVPTIAESGLPGF